MENELKQFKRAGAIIARHRVSVWPGSLTQVSYP